MITHKSELTPPPKSIVPVFLCCQKMQDFQQGSSITLYDEFGSTSYIQPSVGPVDPINLSTNSNNSRIYDQPISSYPLIYANQSNLSAESINEIRDCANTRNWGDQHTELREANFVDISGDTFDTGIWCGIYLYLIPGKLYKFEGYGVTLSLEDIWQDDAIIIKDNQYGLIDGDFSQALKEKLVVQYCIKWVPST